MFCETFAVSTMIFNHLPMCSAILYYVGIGEVPPNTDADVNVRIAN